MSLTVDGWSGSIWSVQPWTGMMNTASSVNSCHQSRGRADGPLTAAHALGAREGSRRWRGEGPQVWQGQEEGGGVQTVECGSIRRAGVYTLACRAARITKGGWSALMRSHWEGFILRCCRRRRRLRTSTRRLDKSWLCIVFGRLRRNEMCRFPSVDVGRH